MATAYPGAYNVFIQDHEATGSLTTDFSRNPEDFELNQYAQIVPTQKTAGYYLRMTVEEAGRIQNTDLRDFEWPDGAFADREEDNWGNESHEFFPIRLKRRKFGFNLGDLTVDQATWDIVAGHSRIKAQQAMTARTQLAVTELTTSGNHDNTSAVTSITGVTGTWDASTTARSDIKRSINHAIDTILQATLAAVDPGDFILVMNPTLAKEISESQEIIDYIKGSPEALAQIKGELPGGRNRLFGLPNRLHGVEVVIEKTVKVTSAKGATRATSYVYPSASPAVVSRPGGLMGQEGVPSFSSLSVFMLEEMTVETKRDEDNRRTRGRVVENYGVELTAPAASFLFTSAT